MDTLAFFLLLPLIFHSTFGNPIPYQNEALSSYSPCSALPLHHQERDAIIEAFTSQGVVPDLIPSIEPRVSVGVSFGNATVNLGNTLSMNCALLTEQPIDHSSSIDFVAATQIEPSYHLSPLGQLPAEQTNYTVIFLDADNPDTWKIPTVFYLGVDYKPACALTAPPPTVLVPWSYGTYPLGRSPHRYAILVYLQTRTPVFSVGPGVSGRYTFPLVEFIKDNDLKLVGGNFFKENGLG